MVDLGQDLDVVGPVTLTAGRRLAEMARQVAEVFRARLDRDVPALRDDRTRSPRQWPGRITRSMPVGTSRCRATQSGAISAATEIGKTATSAVKPARGASSSSTCRNANSARRPVTNKIARTVGPTGLVIHKGPRPTDRSPDRPAIDAEDLAGEESGVGTDQKAGDPGDVVGRAPSGQRGLAEHTLLPGWRGRLAPGGLDPAGGQGVDPDRWCQASARLRVKAMIAPLAAANSSPESPSMPVSA